MGGSPAVYAAPWSVGETMNVIRPSYVSRPDPSTWDQPAMAEAVAQRDITKIYRLLCRVGFSQQQIAALAGQSQPEVSAILHGRRVMAYDVLARIVVGLGIPRARAGLGFCVCPSVPGDVECLGEPRLVAL
jgi:predicted XRE-type DNA-binding protein